MHNITYISEVDRTRLVVLNDALRMCETAEEQQEVRAEIEILEAKRKTLSECDMLECTELRTVIWEKFDRLNRTGKYNIAQGFKAMLRQIEIQQSIIVRQAAEDDYKRRLLERETKALRAIEASKEKDNRETESDDNSKAQSVSSRWTVGIGSLD